MVFNNIIIKYVFFLISVNKMLFFYMYVIYLILLYKILIMGFYSYDYFLLQFQHKGVIVLQACLDVTILSLNLGFFLLSFYFKDLILLTFLLIIAYYITNSIVPSISKSPFGIGDYPEINPKNDWWKDVKDTISENKTTIFVCSVSVGIAIYFYYKYQTTSSDLVEILKQTKELENLVKKETRFTLYGSSIDQKESLDVVKTLRVLLENEAQLRDLLLENKRLKDLVKQLEVLVGNLEVSAENLEVSIEKNQSVHASKQLTSQQSLVLENERLKDLVKQLELELEVSAKKQKGTRFTLIGSSMNKKKV